MKKVTAIIVLAAVLIAGTAFAQTFEPGDEIVIKERPTSLLDEPSFFEGTLVELGLTYVIYTNDAGVWLVPLANIHSLRRIPTVEPY